MQQDGETGSGRDDTILKKPVLATLAAVGLLALLGSLVGATTIGPGRVTTDTFNTTDTAISFNDNLTLNDNNLTGGEIVEADQFTTVENTSLAAINEALSKYDYVKLRPTAYSGDTQVLLNVSSSKTGDKVLDASGAKIDCSQLSKTCLMVTGNTFNTKASVIGGHWRGPTPSGDMMGSKGIEVRDIPSAIVEPRRVEGFDYGIYLNNVNSWTEGTKVDVRRGNDNNYTLVFNGSINSAGTHSFKATDVNIDFAHPRNATMWALNDAKIYDSEIDVSGFFAYDNIVGIHLENISGMHGTILRPKFEDAGTVNSNTKGMVIDQLPTSPIVMHPSFASNLDTRIENNAANELIEIDHAAQDVLDLKADNIRAKGTVEIHEGSSGDFSIWQEFRDNDETIRFQFASNDQDDFRLLAKQTDQDVIFKNEKMDRLG